MIDPHTLFTLNKSTMVTMIMTMTMIMMMTKIMTMTLIIKVTPAEDWGENGVGS